MGTITESFQQLTEVLQAQQQARAPRSSSLESDLLTQRLLKPLLPASMRTGPASIVDVRDRQVGPFDIVGSLESFPSFGEGAASMTPADGVVFCLHVRSPETTNLSEFGAMAQALKKLERKTPKPLFCAAVTYGLLPLQELSEFLKGAEGEAVDGILSLGHHVIVRNSQGWYGDPEDIPFVTERESAAALKAFAFLLVHMTQSSLGQPFGLSAYQHL